MKNKLKTLLVTAIAVVVSLANLNAEDITSQVPTTLNRTYNISDVDIETPGGTLLNSVEWLKIWEESPYLNQSFYVTIYFGQRETIGRDPGTGEFYLNRHEVSFQARQTAVPSLMEYRLYFRWWVDGEPQHPGRLGWVYYDASAQNMADLYGYSDKSTGCLGYYSTWFATPGGNVQTESRLTKEIYLFDLTQQNPNSIIWVEVQELGSPVETERLTPGELDSAVLGDEMGEWCAPEIKVFRSGNNEY